MYCDIMNTNLSNINLSRRALSGIDLTGCRLEVGSSRGDVLPEPIPVMSEAWTVTGKTNEDADRNIIKNLTGNGNDLVLSNFAFAENSGYGLYNENYNNWTKVFARANFTVTSNKINVTSIIKEEFATFIYKQVNSLKLKIKVTGLPSEAWLVVGSWEINLYEIKQDGIYNIDVTSTANVIGFRVNKILESCNITIEQIPDYGDYLVTDGVDDKIRSSKDLLFGNDWSIIGDWQFLANADNNCGLIKTNQVWIYNSVSGMNVFLKTSASRFTFPSNKFRALTSDGKIYDENWNQYDVDTIGSNVDAIGALMLGYGSYGFTKIAFKNLAIYNDHILTKEQCISEYNRLQALKP